MTRAHKILVKSIFSLLLFLPLLSLATAKDSSSWQISLVPYFWMTNLEGTTEVNGEKTKVDEGFFDLLKKINMVFMLGVEARKGDWGAYINPMYTSMRDDAKVGSVDVTLRNQMLAFEFGGFYRLAEWQSRSTALQQNYIDLRFGGRYWNKKSTIDVGYNGAGVFSTSMNTSWVDPIVGLRCNLFLGDKWFINLAGDIGGGGLSKSSNFTFDAFAGPGYSFTEYTSLIFGYRALYVSRKDNIGGMDMYSHTTMHGPIVALEVRF